MLLKDTLIQSFSKGCKPREQWRIGLEHEQFAFTAEDGKPLSYAGSPGIRLFLEEMARRFDWSPKYEGEHIIALVRDGYSLTLEPAGQIELSGAPHSTIAGMVGEHQAYLEEIRQVGEDLGLGYCSAGFHPHWRRQDMNWMPKERYKIMRRYLPTRGDMALDMMTRTCGSQINLDFADEGDMVRKMRVAIGLQPVLTALFANSWQVEGKDTGHASFRSKTWLDTDPDRCGILPFVFEEDMGFERYVDYALDVPMFFIMRRREDGSPEEMIDMAGKSFRQFMNGELPESERWGPATLEDWEHHLTTLFPEVRLKSFIELRGTDSVPPPLLYAIASFWVGLLYNNHALGNAAGIISNWSVQDHQTFRREVPKNGLETTVPQSNGTIRDFAPEIIRLARSGLERQPLQEAGLVYLDHLSSRLEETLAEGSLCG